ncbi:MAG: hypothetical protein AAGB51_05905 [Planctomycetota bacterium]
MTDHTPDRQQDDTFQPVPEMDAAADARELLISRVIDGAASPEDWTELRARASEDATIWRDLAESQQDQTSLHAELDAALAIADRVDIPEDAVNPAAFGRTLNGRIRTVTAWSGWALAAALALVATVGGISIGTQGPVGVQAGFYPVNSPGDALDLYLQKGVEAGEVVAEMPAKILLETRENPAGEGFEVLYYRQILERRVVPDMMNLQQSGIMPQVQGGVPTEPIELGPNEF